MDIEILIEYRDRPKGSASKLNTLSDGIKVIKTILRLFKEYKPTIFFGTIGLIFLIISIIFGVPVFIEYFKTGLVKRFPTLNDISIKFCMWNNIRSSSKKHSLLFELILIDKK